jgi:hypothetical protein
VVTRSEAVIRINDGLGFRPSGHSLEPKIILRLQEAQRDLEKGKTLPRFLIQENQTLTLLADTHSVLLPTGFIRESDDNRLHFFNQSSDIAQYLKPKRYSDAVVSNLREQGPVGPSIYVIRNQTIDFITLADVDYVLSWDYYKADAVLQTDVENAWLREASEWLIGEAGYRMAKDLRDADGVQLFDGLRTQGRAAVFGDIIADEDSGGPLIMGVNL